MQLEVGRMPVEEMVDNIHHPLFGKVTDILIQFAGMIAT